MRCAKVDVFWEKAKTRMVQCPCPCAWPTC